MKIPARALLTILLGLLLFHLAPLPAFAGYNQYWCKDSAVAGCTTVPQCESEFHAGECEKDARGDCVNPGWYDCISDNGTPCTDAGGVCSDSCGPDDVSYPPGDVECATGMCCQPADENGNGDGGIACPGGCCPTPIGCIPTNLNSFAQWAFERAIYLGILIAILLIIISGYGIVSSTGDPEGLAAAKSRLTAAIAGLLFLLFSVIILRIIACDIIGGAAKEFFCP